MGTKNEGQCAFCGKSLLATKSQKYGTVLCFDIERFIVPGWCCRIASTEMESCLDGSPYSISLDFILFLKAVNWFNVGPALNDWHDEGGASSFYLCKLFIRWPNGFSVKVSCSARRREKSKAGSFALARNTAFTWSERACCECSVAKVPHNTRAVIGQSCSCLGKVNWNCSKSWKAFELIWR